MPKLSFVTQPMISHYRVVRRLGAGGMGNVLLAHDTTLDRAVALKVMSSELAKEPDRRQRFHAEAKAASGLNHPNICVIYEVGETPESLPFLAMEYVEGQTLDGTQGMGKFTLREVVAIGLQVADALEAAHTRGIIHRDIKPGNIMLDRRGQVKVLDFGLAKRFLATGPGADSTLCAPDTQTGFLIGTPHYMSPEQVLGRELDQRSDIFSLGVVLYELISGQRPFLGRTVGEIINAIVNQTPASLGLESPLYAPTLDGIIFKCLEKEPARRYASAKALMEDLARLREVIDQPVPAAKPEKQIQGHDTKLWQLASKAKTQGGQLIVRWTAAGLLVLGLGGLTFALLRPDRVVTGSQRDLVTAGQKSVAVLPFDNFSAERDTDYLSDGLTEEITTALSRIPGLKVVARNSAFTFKGRKEDARKIGEALKVGTLLEGSIRKVGNQIRVTAQLINVADGYHLWSETYDRTLEDLFAVQQEIAQRIVERLTGGETATLRSLATVDREAHQLYLRARHYWNKRSDADLRRAIQLFREAIDRDPTYAAAHAGLAASYLVLPIYSIDARPQDYKPLARAAAQKAIELDPNCAEAYTVLGSLLGGEGTYEPAEEYFQRAIALDPNYATAHHWYSRLLLLQGRPAEALQERRQAVELDPLSPIIHATIPEWYYLTGDYPRALAEADSVIKRFPTFPVVRWVKVATLLKLQRYTEAIDEIDATRLLQPEEPLGLLDMRAYALARSGQESAARDILKQFEVQLQSGKPLDGGIAFIHLGLRDHERALDALERAFAREGMDETIVIEPLWEELRTHPRFKALVARMGVKD